ncbi:MAG TPA: Dna2/Cas4 domain-containing protein [Candidatus Nealsonbacteria bacterium]|uniref:PD-(D/E)XK endonuclease-like domain-containing protein n=1 Tax=marine sediment metagenome TaxID=412755 RepID=A0A0F9VCM4_9ZZZZ|nr:Dna2/Cas4 domain-containing protein [Candidatus Nealsonbacteria bacterium]HEB46323.1 Dna2/Cas4 domain-containing protein [Candidatus Nealsonbacteria bacterium]
MLKELIDKFYLDRQKDKEQHHFYITDAGRCPRATFLKFKNAPRKEMEAKILRMFDHGDYIHQLIMKPLLGIREIHVVASEVNIPPQELISGRADAIISDGQELHVLDIKSMNSIIFRNLQQPKEENVNQIQLYLHYFKIKKGILLYVNKDTQELKEFVVDYDKAQVQSLLSGLTNLKTKIHSNIVPSRMESWPSNWQCRYCQFKEICRMAGSGEVNWEGFKRKIEQLNSKES